MGVDTLIGTPVAGAGGPFVLGELVRISVNKTVVKAQASSTPGIQGYYGVVAAGSYATGTSPPIVTHGSHALVRLEAGLTPVANETLYISASLAGRATNVVPGIAAAIGIIVDASLYASNGLVFALLNGGTGSGGSGAQGAQGAQGATGTGAQGAQGAAGAGGAQGAQGAAGAGGAQGAQGTAGAGGAQGAQGAAGAGGAQGAQGSQGAAGSQGNGVTYFQINEDFTPSFGGGIGVYLSSLAVNTGTAALIASEAGHPGILRLTAPIATAVAEAISNFSIYNQAGGGAVEIRIAFRIPTLPNGTNRFTTYAGLNTTTPDTGASCIQLRYVDNVNGGKFQYVCRSASVETTADSGLTPIAGTWYYLLISINAAGTSVTFTINGANSQTIATNVPTASMGAALAAVYGGGVGTGGAADFDVFNYLQTFTTPRS